MLAGIIEIVIKLVNWVYFGKSVAQNVAMMSNVAANWVKSQINCKFAGCDRGNLL
jgi:hypothetical protein